MYALLGLFALIAAFVYLKSSGMRTLPRLMVAAITFIVPAAVVLAVIFIGDRPLPCSRSYDPQTKVMGPLEDCDPPPSWWTLEGEIADWQACKESADTCIPSAEWNARIERLKKNVP